MVIEVKTSDFNVLHRFLKIWYNDIGAKPLVLSKNGILIKYAYKCLKIHEGDRIYGGLVFVKLLSTNKI